MYSYKCLIFTHSKIDALNISYIEKVSSKGAAQIPTQFRVKWPYGIVPYIIGPEYCMKLTFHLNKPYLVLIKSSLKKAEANKLVIWSGLKLVEDLTRVNGKDCIRFVPRTVEQTYIRVYSGGGCSSYVFNFDHLTCFCLF
jgi:hypothetical protein